MRGSTFVICFHCGLTCWKLRKCQYLITVWNTWINYSCAAFEPRAPCVYFTYACYITNAWSFQRKCIENKWYGEWCGYDKLTVERNIQRATGKRITLLFRLGLQLASPSSFHWSPPPPSHLFAPVKGKKRQALDESTFDLTEAPLLLLLSFTHHPPSPPGWGAVKSSEASLPDRARPRLRALSSTGPMLLEGG